MEKRSKRVQLTPDNWLYERLFHKRKNTSYLNFQLNLYRL